MLRQHHHTARPFGNRPVIWRPVSFRVSSSNRPTLPWSSRGRNSLLCSALGEGSWGSSVQPSTSTSADKSASDTYTNYDLQANSDTSNNLEKSPETNVTSAGDGADGPGEDSWEFWMSQFKDLDVAAEQQDFLQVAMRDAVRCEEYSRAAAAKKDLVAVQAKDIVAAVQRDLAEALQNEEYNKAAELRDKGMAWTQGWWAGTGIDKDPVGHILHVRNDFGRWTGRVYSARDVGRLAGWSENSSPGRRGMGAKPTVIETPTGTPAMEIFVIRNAAGELVHQAVSLAPPADQQDNDKQVDSTIDVTTSNSSTGASAAGTESGSDVDKVANMLGLGPLLRLTVTVSQDGSATIKATPIGPQKKKKQSDPEPEKGDESSSSSIKADVNEVKEQKKKPEVRSKFSEWEAAEAEATLRELADLGDFVTPSAPNNPAAAAGPSSKSETVLESASSMSDAKEASNVDDEGQIQQEESADSIKASAQDDESAEQENQFIKQTSSISTIEIKDEIVIIREYEDDEVEVESRYTAELGGEAAADAEAAAAAAAAEVNSDESSAGGADDEDEILLMGTVAQDLADEDEEKEAEKEYADELEETLRALADLTPDDGAVLEVEKISVDVTEGEEDDMDGSLVFEAVSELSESGATQADDPQAANSSTQDSKAAPASSQQEEKLLAETADEKNNDNCITLSQEQFDARVRAGVITDANAPTTSSNESSGASSEPQQDTSESQATTESSSTSESADAVVIEPSSSSSETRTSSSSSSPSGSSSIPIDEELMPKRHRSPATIERIGMDEFLFTLPASSTTSQSQAGAAPVTTDSEDPNVALRYEVLIPVGSVGNSTVTSQAITMVAQRVARAQAKKAGVDVDADALKEALQSLLTNLVSGQTADVSVPSTTASSSISEDTATATTSAASTAATTSTSSNGKIAAVSKCVRYTRLTPSRVKTDWAEGLYVGVFGPWGSELLQLRRVFAEGEELVEAVKVTGDPHVPVGAVSFRAKIGRKHRLSGSPAFPEELGVAARYKGEGRVAGYGFSKPRWVDGELLVFSSGSPIADGAELGFIWNVPGERKFLILLNKVDLDVCTKKVMPLAQF